MKVSNFLNWRDFEGSQPEKFYKTTLWEGEHVMVGLNCLEPGQSQPVHAHIAPANEDRQRQKQAEEDHEDELRLPDVEKAHPAVHRRAFTFCGLRFATLG